jgi:hypothetical protein
MMEHLIKKSEIKHGVGLDLLLMMKEIGRGAHHFTINRNIWGAEWAYTMDGVSRRN